MKSLILEVSSLGTDRAGEELPYRIQIGNEIKTGNLVGKHAGAAPFRRFIMDIDDSADPVLLTPDARLALVIESRA